MPNPMAALGSPSSSHASPVSSPASRTAAPSSPGGSSASHRSPKSTTARAHFCDLTGARARDLEACLHRQISDDTENTSRADDSAAKGRITQTASFGLTSDFVRIEGKDENGKLRLPIRILSTVLSSMVTDVFFLCVMVLDIGLNCTDIDFRAAGKPVPLWLEVASVCCLLLYSLEFGAALIVHGFATVDCFFILDFIILLAGYLELFVTTLGLATTELGMLRMLRVIRIIRIMRIVRKSPMLKELRKLMTMFTSCIKTLAWSFLFLFLVMTIWSMAAVELIHPVIKSMAEDGEFSDCIDCSSSMSSVMRANLYAFKTIISGDSWGQVAVPVIEKNWLTAIIFCGSLLSIVFGVLNLVVAVVVDTAAEQRQKDVTYLAMDMDHEQQMDLKSLTKIFKKIDEDGSGELELEELIKGAQTVPEFQSRLRVMDIDQTDLTQLFHMLDADGGGSISPEEFKYALSRFLHDPKTATRFVKHNVMRMAAEQEEHRQLLKDVLKKLDKVRRSLKSSPQRPRSAASKEKVKLDIETTEESFSPSSEMSERAASRASTQSAADFILQQRRPPALLISGGLSVFDSEEPAHSADISLAVESSVAAATKATKAASMDAMELALAEGRSQLEESIADLRMLQDQICSAPGISRRRGAGRAQSTLKPFEEVELVEGLPCSSVGSVGLAATAVGLQLLALQAVPDDQPVQPPNDTSKTHINLDESFEETRNESV
eukprot:TRINITY_DN18955_c0_g1_i2.p1 TRINITY_DN18955_c0_g1~~TRINITY_DN18955_c0_g1_i2.p1  ORF type:complete len:720 (+),score=167.68 TRINITY_DN18955_c0_g1_i2:52-2211(+)